MTKIDKTQLKVIWFYVVALLVAIVSITIYYLKSGEVKQPEYSVNLIQVENGYGYEVSVNGKVYILQEFIPAIEGKHTFKDPQSAQKTGQLTVKKLMEGKNPSVTKQELMELGVSVE